MDETATGGPGVTPPLPPLLELVRVRVLEFLREPAALFWTFLFPVMLSVALGLAFRTRSLDEIAVGVVEGPAAAWMVEAMSASPELIPRLLPSSAAEEAMRRGEVDIVVAALPGFQPPAAPGRGSSPRPVFRLHYDPTRPHSLAARLSVADALQRGLGRQDRAQIQADEATAQGSRYVDFLIPGLIGTNLMVTGLWGVGFVAVRARAGKLLKRLVATPMRRADYLLSLVLARMVFLVLEAGALLGVGVLVFDMVVRGSWLDLAILLLVGALSFSGLALLVAARPRSIEAISGWMNLVIIPAGLLSGTFFSYTRFPALLIPFIRALPLTALNDALRSVINEGEPLTASWQELLVMVAWGAVSFALGLRLFRWQ